MRFWLAATRGGCPLAFVGQVAAATATNQTALDSGVHRLRWESLNSSFAHFLQSSTAAASGRGIGGLLGAACSC